MKSLVGAAAVASSVDPSVRGKRLSSGYGPLQVAVRYCQKASSEVAESCVAKQWFAVSRYGTELPVVVFIRPPEQT